MRTLILSDCLIGNEETNIVKLNLFLHNLECDRIIFAGDLFDLKCATSASIKHDYRPTLDFISRLWTKKVKIEYLLGDHDKDYLLDPIMGPLELPVVTSVDFSTPNGRKIKVIHGHEFDHFFRWHRLIAPISKFFGGKPTYRNCNHFTGDLYQVAVDEIHTGAREAHTGKTDVLVMGHTRTPCHLTCLDNLVETYDCGDWETHASYVEIMGDKINIRYLA